MELLGEVTADGCVELRWRAPEQAPRSFQLLIVRTGAVPAFTSLLLDGRTRRYQIEHLSRHQRYLMMVQAPGGGASEWLSVTPRAGLAPVIERRLLEDYLAQPRRFVVMPQERRITAFWTISAGFVDRLLVEVRLAPPAARSPWFRRLLAGGTTCLLGANTVERGADGEPAFGLTFPGQVVRLGLGDLAGVGARRICEVCGRSLEVTHRQDLPEAAAEAEVDRALLGA